MRKTQSSLIVMAVLLISSFYLGYTTTPTVAQGSIDADVQAGDTYFYNITKFPSFQDILELSGATQNFDANNSISITGGLAGSQIYAKVMDKNMENFTYWDGTNEVTGDLPTVDLSVGLITGQAISVNATIDGNSSVADVPAGLGLPIPFIFGSATMFNSSGFYDSPFLPVPLVLNNDYALHELIFTQLASQVKSGTISVTNDNSQFKVTASNVAVDQNSTIFLDGFVSWNKPSGIAQEINIVLTNSTSAKTLFDIDIDLVRQEYRPLNISVGDKYELSISNAVFDATAWGFPAEDNPQPQLDEIAANATALIGEKLISFQVVEVDGLYYSIEGTVHDPQTGETMAFPEKDGVREDIWMVGFGRLGPGVPLPFNDPARTYREEEFYNMTSNQYEWRFTDQVVPTRERALPGPFTTADYDIFAAWDATVAAGVSTFNDQLNFLLDVVDSMDNYVSISGTNSAEPTASVVFSAGLTGTTYEWSLDASLDISVWSNDTYVWSDSFGNNITEERYTYVNVTGSGSASMVYENNMFKSFTVTAAADISVHDYNSTFDAIAGINFTEVTLQVSGAYTPAPPVTSSTSTTSSTTSTTDTSGSTTSTSGTSSSGSSSASLPVPGFEMFVGILGILGLGIIVRFRKYD